MKTVLNNFYFSLLKLIDSIAGINCERYVVVYKSRRGINYEIDGSIFKEVAEYKLKQWEMSYPNQVFCIRDV